MHRHARAPFVRRASLVGPRFTARGAFATVRRPDGSGFTLLAGAANTAFEHDPLGGVYEVVLRLPEDTRRGRWLRLRTSLR